MRIKIVKALIRWLGKNYPFLMMDEVIGTGRHLHKNPRKKARVMTEAQYQQEQDRLEQTDDVGI